MVVGLVTTDSAEWGGRKVSVDEEGGPMPPRAWPSRHRALSRGEMGDSRAFLRRHSHIQSGRSKWLRNLWEGQVPDGMLLVTDGVGW